MHAPNPVASESDALPNVSSSAKWVHTFRKVFSPAKLMVQVDSMEIEPSQSIIQSSMGPSPMKASRRSLLADFSQVFSQAAAAAAPVVQRRDQGVSKELALCGATGSSTSRAG